ncbi:MAG: tRNA dihydrouridine synthase DusB [Spirochaetaceae bacterium]|nr:tRNA dihydrouridine synthase DusB [Spirochaetaceae bacterium]
MSLYHSVHIGNLKVPGNLFLAPVAGYSDRAFRFICKENGADMGYTEMVSSEAIYRGSDKSEKLLLKAQNDPLFAVQIFGGNETAIFEGSSFIIKKYSPSLLDINAGCPVPKIIKSGAGSALTREPEKLYKMVKAAILATKETDNPALPVTVKIRSGWDSSHLSWKEAALAAYEAGVAAITIHPRTKAQGYEGKSDWSILAELVDLFKDKKNSSGSKIQIFGSGDVFSPEDAKNMLEQTKCDGVMFARGAMGNPFIFNQTKDLLTKGSYEEVSIQHRINTGLKELEILIEDSNEQIACREMRKRFCCYAKGFSGSSQIRMQIVQAQTFDDYKKIFSSFL